MITLAWTTKPTEPGLYYMRLARKKEYTVTNTKYLVRKGNRLLACDSPSATGTFVDEFDPEGVDWAGPLPPPPK